MRCMHALRSRAPGYAVILEAINKYIYMNMSCLADYPVLFEYTQKCVYVYLTESKTKSFT